MIWVDFLDSGEKKRWRRPPSSKSI